MPRGCCCGEKKYFGSDAAAAELVELREHEHERGLGHRDFTIAGAARHYAPSFVLEPIHIVASLDVNIESKSVKAEVTTTIKCNTVPGSNPPRKLAFDAVNFKSIARVEDVTDDHNNEVEDWRYDGVQLEVIWKKPFNRREQRQVKVVYEVEHPVSGIIFSSPTTEQPNQPRFAITDHETERARYWLPCIDNPAIRTSLEFIIKGGKNDTIIANGIQDGAEVIQDESKTARWKLSARCPSYLICFAVGDFAHYKDESVNNIPIEYFCNRKTEHGEHSSENLKISFYKTPEIMKWMVNKLRNPFPFPKYFQIAAPGIGGAMENISLTTWDEFFVLDEVFAPEYRLFGTDPVNVHEMAHSYFGDSIVMRHFEHAWLKESWANYMETLWFEDNVSREEAEYDLLASARRYFDECESYVRPIVTRFYNHSWNLFDAHLYPGGAWRLHMLRNLIGNELFWDAVADYITTYTGTLADTDDFQKKLEKHSSLNLTPFFDEWIYGKGYPKLKGSFSYSAEKKEAKVTLEQTQKDEKKGIDLFKTLEVEVEITDEQNNVRTAILTFDSKGVGSVAFDSLAGKVTKIRIDPKVKVLFSLDFNPGQDILRNNLLKGEDIFTRVRAARELVKIGSRAALDSISEAIDSEKFWGVRAFIGEQLAREKTYLTIPLLAKLLAKETDPRALSVILMFCKFKDATLRTALLDVLKRDNLGYRAKSRAIEALGFQLEYQTDKNIILSGTKEISFKFLVAAGAYRAVGASRTEEGFELLKTALLNPQSVPQACLPAIMYAASSSAKWQPELKKREIVDIIRQFLRNPVPSLRNEAIISLVSLGAKECVGAIAALKPFLPAQDHSWLERKLTSLKRSGDDNIDSLKKTIEELETKLRKLEEKFDKKEKEEAELKAKQEKNKSNEKKDAPSTISASTQTVLDQATQTAQ